MQRLVTARVTNPHQREQVLLEYSHIQHQTYLHLVLIEFFGLFLSNDK
jgi:hypothetical protein